jgi:hypothetical protein
MHTKGRGWLFTGAILSPREICGFELPDSLLFFDRVTARGICPGERHQLTFPRLCALDARSLGFQYGHMRMSL